MCALLSELQAADRSFARNVWYLRFSGETSMDVALTQASVAASVFTSWFPGRRCLDSSPLRLRRDS